MNCTHHWLLESTTCRCSDIAVPHFHGECKHCDARNVWPSLLFWWDAIIPEDHVYAGKYGRAVVRSIKEEEEELV